MSEQKTSGLAGPRDLLDGLEARVGQGSELPGGEIGVELWRPGIPTTKPEDQSFYVASRLQESSAMEYIWRQVIPGAMTLRSDLVFDLDNEHDEKVYEITRPTIMWHQDEEEVEELSPERIDGLCWDVRSPLLIPRQEGIRQFYAEQNAARPKSVRPIFRVLGIDKPPKSF